MPDKEKKDKQKCPLKEKEDYPESIKHMVKKKLAELDRQENHEHSLYLAQDLEDHLLTQRISIKDLTRKEIDQIMKDLRRGC